MMMKYFLPALLAFAIFSNSPVAQVLPVDSNPIDKMVLPQGYQIEIYASGLQDAREMAFMEDGTLFVGSSDAGKVYAIKKNREVVVVDDHMDMPSGVEYFNGDLYVASRSGIFKYGNIQEQLGLNPEPVLLNSNFPVDSIMFLKYIRIGRDQKMYIPIGTDCNACLPDSIWHGRILRMSLDGNTLEYYAYGIRNCQGMDWDPVLKVLWFTDMGRNDLGKDFPPDELNKALVDGEHFGFPYINGPKTDPVFWADRPKSMGFISPKYYLTPHSGASGMCFYAGKMFDKKYQGGIFIAEHGSDNHKIPAGYCISFIPVEDGLPKGYEIFCSGWLQGNNAWGSPADVRVGPDGSLYVSDDLAGCVYRIYKF